MNQRPRAEADLPKDEIAVARREVARAERQLSHRLGEATAAGEATVKRAFAVAKPALIGIAVAAGVVWVVSLLRRPRRRAASNPSEPSIIKEAVRAAALGLASAAA